MDTADSVPFTDPEFAALLVPLTEHENALLLDSLRREGCRDPLTVWGGQNTLLDGHARLRLCRAHGIPFAVREVDLPDREAAIQFVLARQLGRRNLRPLAVAYYIGKLYQSVRRQGSRTDLTSGQKDRQWADERLAEQYGVSPRTVSRDYALARALDRLGQESFLTEEFRGEVLCGRARLPRREIIRLARMKSAVEMREEIARKKLEREARRERAGAARGQAAPSADGRGGEADPAADEAAPPTPGGTPSPTPPDSTGGPDHCPPGTPVPDPVTAGPARPAGSGNPGGRGDGVPGGEVGRAEPDKGLLDELYGLWLKADDVTKLAFLGMPYVRALLRRDDEVAAAAAKVGAA